MTIRPLGTAGTFAVLAGALMLSATPTSAQEHEFAGQLTELAQGPLLEIAEDPLIIAAIRAQNTVSEGYDQARIGELDAQWRAEVDSADQPLIEEVLGSDASRQLLQVQEEAAGLYSEIFIMDARGLNVAQSTVTSDYWQGDEEKFIQSFGTGAVHLGAIEQDESTQVFQSQVSMTVADPDSGAPIGVLTVGVDLAQL